MKKMNKTFGSNIMCGSIKHQLFDLILIQISVLFKAKLY